MATKKRLTVREHILRKMIDGIVREAINGVRIDIFDLQKIWDAAEKAATESEAKKLPDTEIDAAIKSAVDVAVEQYRKN